MVVTRSTLQLDFMLSYQLSHSDMERSPLMNLGTSEMKLLRMDVLYWL